MDTVSIAAGETCSLVRLVGSSILAVRCVCERAGDPERGAACQERPECSRLQGLVMSHPLMGNVWQLKLCRGPPGAPRGLIKVSFALCLRVSSLSHAALTSSSWVMKPVYMQFKTRAFF